jgi:hypothetical protein
MGVNLEGLPFTCPLYRLYRQKKTLVSSARSTTTPKTHQCYGPLFGPFKFQSWAYKIQWAAVFFLSGRNLHPGPMHDSKFWKECHLLAPTVGFSHSEKTLVSSKSPPKHCSTGMILFWLLLELGIGGLRILVKASHLQALFGQARVGKMKRTCCNSK